MFIHRRILALLFSSIVALPGFALSDISTPGAPAITLDEAIQRALAKNFSIKVEGFDAAIAAARVTEALGKFDPVLSGSYNHAENRNPLLTFDSTSGLRNTTRDETDTYDLGFGGLLP